MTNLLKDCPAVIRFPIKWGEMDAYQHLNNTVYFRYFEDARIAYFDKIALDACKTETGIGPILASTSCKFRIPLTYPDEVSVGARIISLSADRFTMAYRIWSHRHNALAAEGEGVLVAFDYEKGKKAPVPEALRQRIIALEGEAVAVSEAKPATRN